MSFFADVTEAVWVPLKDCLEADYRRQLKFQLMQDGVALTAGDDESKVSILFTNIYFLFLRSFFIVFFIAQTASSLELMRLDNVKVALRTKVQSICQNLNGATFIHF